MRTRRALGTAALLLLALLLLYQAVGWFAALRADELRSAAATVGHGRAWLARHGPWLHLAVHGGTYLYLIWRWPRLVAWLDRRRARRGRGPLDGAARRRLAATTVLACGAYELLLWTRAWF